MKILRFLSITLICSFLTLKEIPLISIITFLSLLYLIKPYDNNFAVFGKSIFSGLLGSGLGVLSIIPKISGETIIGYPITAITLGSPFILLGSFLMVLFHDKKYITIGNC